MVGGGSTGDVGKLKNMTATGETIGPYVLGKCLGKGGFGAVFEATHGETGQRVAIKLLHGSKEMEPEIQNRFVREVALLQRLEHDNIVRVFEGGLHEGSIYCAMELVDSGTLKDVLGVRHELPWREAAEVALQVCHGLHHAHQRGCVHRDLKPANLYLSQDGIVKIGDLGLARDLENSRLTASGQTVGTWRYMPPEQITAQENIDGRLDLYALGCILFQMVAGQVPFDGPDFATIFDQHLEAAPPRLDLVVDDCPAELADLVEQMLEKQVDARPANAAIVAEGLEKMLAGELTYKQRPKDRLETLMLESDLPDRQPNLTQRLREGQSALERGQNWRGLALGVALLIVVIAILVAIAGK